MHAIYQDTITITFCLKERRRSIYHINLCGSSRKCTSNLTVVIMANPTVVLFANKTFAQFSYRHHRPAQHTNDRYAAQ